MSQQKRNPDVDFGFHATIPRAIRTHYKTLTPMQKWLYVCLKDLCGEHGTCYRTVKALSAETDISTGMISESIPLLHQAGLIHGEKKRRSSGGKEVWHITIVDIWAANGKLHPTKRSLSEQTTEQPKENVHSVNENVQHVNDQGKERSVREQERSLCETEEGSSEAVSSFEEGSSEAGEGANAPTHADISLQREKVEKRITHPRIEAVSASMLSDSQVDIGNDAEEEETPTEKLPAVKLQAVEALQTSMTERQSTVLEQTPGPGALPSAAGPFSGRSHGITSDQAISAPLVGPEPAQAAFPPAGSNPVHVAPTAQASGFVPPKRYRGKGPPVSLTLMGSQVMQWVGEIRGAKPRMTQSNIRGCNGLAECDGISKESLQAYFAHMEAQKREVDLLTAAGETGNDKVGFLSFESNWPQLKKKLNGKGPSQGFSAEHPPADNDYSLTAQLWRQEQRARSGK